MDTDGMISTCDKENTKDKANVRIIVRKRLGCRRSEDRLSSEEEQQAIEVVDDARQHSIGKYPLPQKTSRPMRELKPKRHLIFTSPRIASPDEDLFPSNHSLYKESSDRWQQISEQAGSHQQDGTVMNIGRRPTSASAFRMGIIECAAIRVRSLNLWLDHEKDTLLDWLNVIGEVFVNLEHLILTEDVFLGENDVAVSARMRRLYALSILLPKLPKLKSIDDMVVTTKEREMVSPERCNDCQEANIGKIKSPKQDSNIMTGDQCIDSSINKSVVASSRNDEIEVEFLTAKFQDIKHTETETTASSSPTTCSDSVITATVLEDEFAFKEEEQSVEAEISNDTIAIPTTLSTESKLDTSSRNQNSPAAENDYSIPTKDKDSDSMQHFDKSQHKGMVCSSLSKCTNDNKCDSDGGARNKFLGTRIRAFHDDSNNSIELVSVPSTDLKWSASCGFLNFRKDEICAPKLRPHISSGNKKQSAKEIAQVNQESTIIQLNRKREKESSHFKAYTQACTPVQRQSKIVVSTPQVGCCQILTMEPDSRTKFSFPTSRRRIPSKKYSENRKHPSAQSLSSPFPMQFRERHQPSCVTSNVDLEIKTFHSISFGSQGIRSKINNSIQNDTVTINNLSVVTCPITSLNTTNLTTKTLQEKQLPPRCQHKTKDSFKSKELKLKESTSSLFKENARSTSVMDLDDDLDDDEEFFDNHVDDDGRIRI